MQSMTFYAHSGVRYLVLLIGLVTVAYLAYAVATRRPFDALSRGLMAAFTGVMDLQVLLGLAMLFQISFYPMLMGHLTMMLAAVVIAHVGSVVNRQRPDEQKSNGLLLAAAAAAMLLIVGGIMAIGRPLLGSM